MNKLREIVEKMTPGPWEAQEPAMAPNFGKAKIWPLKITGKLYNCPMILQHDAEGIVTLRNIAPELLAVVEAARETIGLMCQRGRHTDSCKTCVLSRALAALDAKLTHE